MEEKIGDVAIIGLGPAGVAAAIYLKRFGLEPVAFEKDRPGGKLNSVQEIDNYPGFHGTGPELAAALGQQLSEYNIATISSNVIAVFPEEYGFRLQAEDGNHCFRSLIVTAGLREKGYTVPGSESYQGRGISRCAVCDGPLFRGQDVAVYGSGRAAFEETVYLASICRRVALICPDADPAAASDLQTEVGSLANVEILKGFKIVGSEGERSLSALTVEGSGGPRRLEIRALFIFIGSTPTTTFLPFPSVISPTGFIVTDEAMRTKVPGLFAAGDVRATKLRQVVTAVSDGALAAVAARDYLKELKKNGR